MTDLANQRRASHPRASAFVSANAGSGKTTTLVNRVARLLLDRNDPAALLCVTYTKAAAAEMQRRLFETLGDWSIAADADLREALAVLDGSAPDSFDAITLSEARRLFTRALETPGGLKIQTIHAFCERLLKRFPLEAGVSPRFEVADDAMASDLAKEAREAVARRALDGGDNIALSDAYDRFSVALPHDRFQEMFRTFEQRRHELQAWFQAIGGRLAAEIFRSVGVEEGLTTEEVEAEARRPDALRLDLWTRMAEALAASGGKTDAALADCLHALIAEARVGGAVFDKLLPVFFTAAQSSSAGSLPGQGTPRALENKALRGLADEVLAEQARVMALRERWRAARVARDTLDAMVLAAAYVEAYEAAKARRRVLDFADLVAAARRLLTEQADAAWVLFKLDEGIDHILVDEAQDTAPEQWQVLRALTEEFFAGSGAGGRTAERTIFVVGDEKQSIFSFQGAAPEQLLREAREYEQRALALGRPFERVPLRESWRSTPHVLAMVDAVFSPEAMQQGLLNEAADDPVAHVANRLGEPGCVDLWPLERDDATPDRDAWDPPDQPRVGGWRKLAERIAAEVKALIARGEMIHDRRTRLLRPATPGDVLVLVRKRGAMFEEMLRALKRAGVPTAGADRLMLSEHPVFEDALALIRFIQFPEDDLTLAGVLRSPFCDVDEQSLYDLAQPRAGMSLWRALRERASERPEWSAAHALLERCRDEAGGRPPFDFLSRLYASLDDEGRSQRTRLVTRLGPEAGDALDEFLAQARAAEDRGVRELEELAHALFRLDVQVKREMDEPKGEVRVMTAHGAKGLEAPIVILPETVAVNDPTSAGLLRTEDGGFLWCGAKREHCSAAEAAWTLRKRKADEESLRLLYVALTRARDRVIVAGRLNAIQKEENIKGWYPAVRDAFAALAEAAGPDPFGVRPVVSNGMQIRRYGHDPAVGGEDGRAAEPRATPPAWALRPAPADPRARRWASPTELAEQARTPAQSPLATAAGGLGRFRRGELIHRLFQLLPDLPPAERRAAAARLLAREPGLDEAQRAEMIASAFAVLEDGRFADVFGPGSRPEVAIAGGSPRLPAGLAVSGRLDRLVVTPGRVLVVDYKTNRPAPARAEDADPAYLTQMAVYVAVLEALYPGHAVEAALLWTDGARLTPIAAALIERALAELAGR